MRYIAGHFEASISFLKVSSQSTLSLNETYLGGNGAFNFLRLLTAIFSDGILNLWYMNEAKACSLKSLFCEDIQIVRLNHLGLVLWWLRTCDLFLFWELWMHEFDADPDVVDFVEMNILSRDPTWFWTLHDGQVPDCCNHGMTHSLWNKWPHLVATTSAFSLDSMQMLQSNKTSPFDVGALNGCLICPNPLYELWFLNRDVLFWMNKSSLINKYHNYNWELSWKLKSFDLTYSSRCWRYS